MNNQAAQTMPSLIDRVREGHAAWAAYNAVAPGEDRAVGTEKLLAEVLAALSQTAGGPYWIVNDLGELGVMVNGVAYFLYKGDNIVYEDAKHDDGSPMLYRMVGKREFGEVCRPRHWEENGWAAAHRYTQEVVYTPGLSFGKPEDGNWRPLPTQAAAPAASGWENSMATREEAIAEFRSRTGAPVSERIAAAWPSDKIKLMLHEAIAEGVRHEAALSMAEQAIKQAALRAIEQALTQHHDRCPACASNTERYCCGCGWGSVESSKPVAQQRREPVAFVPVHPRNGPLWGDTYANGDAADGRSPHYERMPLYTTPQPSAESLRALVQRWRDEADEIDARGWTCNSNSIRARADELESLLAGGK